jgi:hypothetical protein
MAAMIDHTAHEQHHHQQQQQDQQQSSALLESPQLIAALLGHHSICQDPQVLLVLLQASKQLQAGAALQCAGQLAVEAVLPERPAAVTQGFVAWLQRNAGLLRELHVELRCLGSDSSAVLQCLQEQQQQLQALQGLAVDNRRSSHANGLQDGWANSVLPHLPVGLRRLQLTGPHWFGLAMQQDELAAFSRLQQLTQLTVNFRPFSELQLVPHLRSLDITACADWCDGDQDQDQDALAPLCRLQQLTELRLGKVTAAQLGQQLDVTLAAGVRSQHHKQAAAWFKQHSGIVRRLILDGGCGLLTDHRDWKYVWGEDEEIDNILAALEVVAGAFASVAAAAAVPSVPGAASTTSSSRYPLQSLCVIGMPWLLDGNAVRSLPAGSLTALECSMNFNSSQELVSAISSLTALQALRVAYAGAPRYSSDKDSDIYDWHDSVLAPLSALQQLTQLQLPMVRAAQLAHLRLPRLLVLTATAARTRHRSEEANQLPQECPLQLSHLTSLTRMSIRSSTLLGCDTLPSSLRTVAWEFVRPGWRAGPNADVARFSLQPLQQQPLLQQGLESLHLNFCDLRQDLCDSRLLHELQKDGGRRGTGDMWRLEAAPAEQGIAGDVDPAAAAGVWSGMPLKSVRLAFDQLQYECVRMRKSAVQALGALPLTELCITGPGCFANQLGLDVTPAQLGEVLQRLPLLQHLQLDSFGMLCDESDVAAIHPQQQQQQQPGQQDEQQCKQPYHSAAGVIGMISAAAGLHKLHNLQLGLPLKLTAAAVQQVTAALNQRLSSLPIVKLHDLGSQMWLKSYSA